MLGVTTLSIDETVQYGIVLVPMARRCNILHITGYDKVGGDVD